MGDRASAKEHSENGKALNERKAYLSSGLDMAHSRYELMKAAFDQAKERQTEVLERLKEAINCLGRLGTVLGVPEPSPIVPP